jgi:hypothetical protein
MWLKWHARRMIHTEDTIQGVWLLTRSVSDTVGQVLCTLFALDWSTLHQCSATAWIPCSVWCNYFLHWTALITTMDWDYLDHSQQWSVVSWHLWANLEMMIQTTRSQLRWPHVDRLQNWCTEFTVHRCEYKHVFRILAWHVVGIISRHTSSQPRKIMYFPNCTTVFQPAHRHVISVRRLVISIGRLVVGPIRHVVRVPVWSQVFSHYFRSGC